MAKKSARKLAKRVVKKPAKKPSSKMVKKSVRPAKPASRGGKAAKKTSKSVKAKGKQSRYGNAKMNPVVHFEIPMDNPIRVAEFYKNAFGWNTMDMGADYDGYIMAHTGQTSKDGMLKEKGMINGGFKHKDMQRPAQYPTLVIAVFDLKEAVEKVEKAGGKIVGNPIPIPGYGTYISFVDTEGNRMEMIEADSDWKEKTA